MAEHARTNVSSHRRIVWPLAEDVCTPDCPECDRAIARDLLDLEVDVRLISLELWTAGWVPSELVDEVRRAAGCVEAATLMAQVLLVDDSHRSNQARTPAWRREIDALRVRIGAADVTAGWLTGWLMGQPSARQAAECLTAVVTVLADLVEPRAA